MCTIEGCEDGGRLKRGMCNKHYLRWLHHGDPSVVLPTRRGKTHSAEARAKMSAAQDGRIGENAAHFVHGQSKTPAWYSWSGMFGRCDNPNNPAYPRYGGRGITICDRWRGRNGFTNFLADMGPRPEGKTLDRIDSNGNYEPIAGGPLRRSRPITGAIRARK